MRKREEKNKMQVTTHMALERISNGSMKVPDKDSMPKELEFKISGRNVSLSGEGQQYFYRATARRKFGVLEKREIVERAVGIASTKGYRPSGFDRFLLGIGYIPGQITLKPYTERAKFQITEQEGGAR